MKERCYTRQTGFYRSRTEKRKKKSSWVIFGESQNPATGRLHPLHTQPVPMQYEYALYVGYTIVRATNPRALYFPLRNAVNNERKSSCMCRRVTGNVAYTATIQLHRVGAQWNCDSNVLTSATQGSLTLLLQGEQYRHCSAHSTRFTDCEGP